MEKFIPVYGIVTVNETEEIGMLHGLRDSIITVKAKKSVTSTSYKKEFGIVIIIEKIWAISKKETTVYLDYAELDSLIEALDYMLEINESSTDFSAYQVNYTTKGGFSITSYTCYGETNVTVTSGTYNAYYKLESLPEIRTLISKAKAVIEKVR